MSNASRTGLARSGSGAQFINRQELHRIRRLQNISGPGVAISSRGITITSNQKRPIPAAVPAPSIYDGPWKAALVSGSTTTIQIGSATTLSAKNYININGAQLTASVVTFNADTSLPASSSTTEWILAVQIRIDTNNQSSSAPIAICDVKAFAGASITALNRPSSPINKLGGATGTRTYDVANIHLVPICTFEFNITTRAVGAIKQIQHAPITASVKSSSLGYTSTNKTLYRTYYNSYGNALSTTNIVIPVSSTLAIYQNSSNQLRTTLVGSASPLTEHQIASIKTDAEGHIVYLYDYTSNAAIRDDYLDNRYVLV